MPQIVVWDPVFRTGHGLLDAQHEALLAQCNRLADHCPGRNGTADDAGFDQAFAQLKTLAREHFAAEESLLASGRDSDSAEIAAEREKFEYLMDEVATPRNFSRLELQRFLAVWWLGHIRSMAAEHAAAGA